MLTLNPAQRTGGRVVEGARLESVSMTCDRV